MTSTILDRATRGGMIDPSALAKAFGITKRRLAEAVGLPADAVYRKSRIHNSTTQTRLRDLAEIIDLVSTWHESPMATFNWFSWNPLYQFEGRTAEQVFKSEGIEELKFWWGQVEAGVCI